MKDLTPEEHRRYTAWWDEKKSFFNLQSSEPQTVAYALTDSPAGWLAWLAVKFQDLTDNDGDFLHTVDHDVPQQCNALLGHWDGGLVHAHLSRAPAL